MTAPTKPSEILSAAADLIEPEGAWTRSGFARGADGLTVNPDSPRAVCWCALGALDRISGPLTDEYFIAERVLREAATPKGSIAAWNDHPKRTQAEVVSALRQAAEKAREQEQGS